MKKIGELVQSDDWKKEKHVPVIECTDSIKSGEKLEIKVCVGKEIYHPNTTQPDDDKFSYQLANCEFSAHGESVEGPNQGCLYTDHSITVSAMLKKSGTIVALSFCNIHGLWENNKLIKVS
jgi:superoxide reductase